MIGRIVSRAHAGGRFSDRFAARILFVLGGETSLVQSVVGDLEEEYAAAVETSGSGRARWAYAFNALKSLPYLIADGLRHGAPDARIRLMFCLGGPALVFAFIGIALAVRTGPAASLLPDADATKGIVISSEYPVHIPMRVLDADGSAISGAPVRFTWESGTPVKVSPTGDVTCSRRGEASLRATLGDLSTRVQVDCQPVQSLYTKGWYNLVLGGPAQDLLLGGFGMDGMPVTRLAADVSVDNPTVAAIDRWRLYAKAAGRTRLTLSVGLLATHAMITVFEPVSTLEDLRDDQRYVIASAPLRPNETVRWPLPSGKFSLVNHVDRDGMAPVMAVRGDVECGPAPGRGVYRTFCRAGAGATVTLSHPGTTTASVTGRLAVERDSLP